MVGGHGHRDRPEGGCFEYSEFGSLIWHERKHKNGQMKLTGEVNVTEVDMLQEGKLNVSVTGK